MPGTKRDGGRGKIEADLSERSLWEDQSEWPVTGTDEGQGGGSESRAGGAP